VFIIVYKSQPKYDNVHCIIICILIQGIVRYEIKYIVYKKFKIIGANVETWYTALYISSHLCNAVPN